MSERAEKAVELFKSGCNCSQAVFLAFADKYGIDNNTAMKLASSFGGGMGRMREVCGALSGMLLVNGMETGSSDSSNREAKAENYKKTQELAKKFKEQNGSIYCRELLGISQDKSESYKPAKRDNEYYKKRPCVEIVRGAVEILEAEFSK